MLKPKASWPNWLIMCRMPEFWKAWIIYIYPFIYTVLHTLRLKNRFWPVIINPAIDDTGGFVGASKTHISNLFPAEFTPAFLEFESAEDFNEIIKKVNSVIGYPCFIKPDNLMRGMGVSKLDSENALRNYIRPGLGKFFIQKEINFAEEYGVFISRMPGEKIKIISITGKVFLAVIGDGKSTIKELLDTNFRYKLAKKFIDPIWESRFDTVPENGEYILIQPVGNHNKGTHFKDISEKITPAMVDLFDSIVPLKGVHYGRFDVKANSLKDLETGENLGIIEFNGTVAEPVSYCDSRYNFLQGQKIIMAHFREQRKVAEALLKNGDSAPGLLDGLRLIRRARQFEKANAFTFND